jgi:hypothetical protein
MRRVGGMKAFNLVRGVQKVDTATLGPGAEEAAT